MDIKSSFQSLIAPEITRYISLKQALGRCFQSPTITLLKLDQFLCKLGKPSPNLTEENFTQWVQTMGSVSSNTKLSRMHVIRNFCLYRRRMDPTCFVPDPTQFPRSRQTVKPYIYSDHDVACLLSHSAYIAGSIRSPLRGAAMRLAIVLLYTTGLRRGELLRLIVKDYNPSTQTLLVQSSKFHKSRLLPLPNDVAGEIEQFLTAHNAIRPSLPATTPLLWNPYCGGRGYTGTQLRENLRILLMLAGIKKTDGRLPRIHDFRFSFAVNALIRWYRNGDEVQAKLPFLAAYMGHVSVLSTYYYLSFIEPLATLASTSFAARYGGLIRDIERRRNYHES
jgi:integrase/recombinase XerD